jgi:GT2 family glycosyltransferase
MSVETANGRLQVAVCVCTRNRPGSLERCLRSVTGGDPRVAQVIVSDDSTDNATAEMVATKFPSIRYVEGPRRGLGPNRNHAVRHASSPFVLFLDDDAILGENFLDAIERSHSSMPISPEETIATGVVREGDSLLPPGEQRFLGYMDRVPPRKSGFTALAMPATVFPRRLFEEVAFDERLVYGYDEADLAARARKHGYVIVLCEDAINDHERSPVNRDMYRHHVEAARLYVTFKRYAFTEGRLAKAFFFALIASVHLTASRVKAAGVRGVWESAHTLGVSALNTARYVIGR